MKSGYRQYRRNKFLFSAIGCLLALSLGISSVAAQEIAAPPQADNAAPSDDDNGKCVPPCRSGFFCYEGECKSPCNPPCQAGEFCTRNGLCIPQTTARSSSTAVTTVPPNPQTEASIEARKNYNLAKYKEFEGKKSGGAAMIIIGALGMGGALGIGIASGLQAAEGEDGTPLMIVATGVEVLATVVLISGIVMAVKGRRGMEKAKQNFYDPEQGWTSSLRLERPFAKSPVQDLFNTKMITWGFSF